MSAPLGYPPALLAGIAAYLERCYPEEGCGLVVRRGEEWKFWPISNAVDRFHRADPETFPEDAGRAYLLDPVEQRRARERAAREGWAIVAVAHSHCDADASFSARDRELALAAPGRPLHPGLEYLVVSVVGGRAGEIRAHAWDGSDFTSRIVAV